MDSQGVVYYSDLRNVWALQLDGTKHIARSATCIPTSSGSMPMDNLYGEDVIERRRAVPPPGVATRCQMGSLTDVLPWREGHPTDFYDYGFARDQQGRQYVLRRNPNRIDIWDAGERIQSVDLDVDEGVPSWLIASTIGAHPFHSRRRPLALEPAGRQPDAYRRQSHRAH